MPTTPELSTPVGAGAITPIEPTLAALEEPPLDWIGFCAQSFPGRRPRHDFQAAEAYAAYRRDDTSARGG